MIKGIYITNKKRPGKPIRWYVYAWRGGPCIKSTVGTARPTLGPAEVDLYHKAIAEFQSVKAGTMAGLIRDYRQSPEWLGLAVSTRRNWTIIVDRIEAKWGSTPLAFWNDARMIEKVINWRDESASTPRKADNQITVLRHMLNWARLRARVKINVAQGIPKLYRGGNRAEIVWTPEEIEAIGAPQHLMDAIRLATLTGMRLDDLANLTWGCVGQNMIVYVAAKASRGKRRTVRVPIIRALRVLLDELRSRYRKDDVDTVLVNSFGRDWTSGGLGNSVTRAVKGFTHTDGRQKHLHDMRGTYATRLILAGLTDKDAAEILGWAPERVGNIRKVYVDQERVIVAIAERIDAAENNG